MKTGINYWNHAFMLFAKRCLVIACCLLLTQDTFAEWRNAMMRIREDRGRAISVTVNGRRYPKISRNLTVSDLPAGLHRIKIFQYNSNGHGFTNGRLIYQGEIRVKPGRIYYVTALRGAIDVEENCCIDDYGHWNNNDNWEDWDDDNSCWNNNRNWSNNWNNNNNNNNNWNNNNNDWNTHNDNSDWNNENRDNWTRTDDYNYNDPNWNSFNGRMTNGRFEQVLLQVRKTNFENTKLSVANQAIRNERITVRQLISLLNEFGFENSKLQFAKDNYRRVIDRNNYFMVNDVFTFESSKEELSNFLSSQN
jgi:hypothetical protein